MLGLVNNARVEFSSPIGPWSNCRIDFQNFNKLTSVGDVISSLLGGSLRSGFLLGPGSCRSLAVISFVGSLLFLEIFREELLVSHRCFSRGLPGVDLTRLVESLTSVSLLSNKSLDLGGFVESLVTLGDFSANNILGNVILLSEGEGLSNLANSLGTESSGSLGVGESSDISITLLEDLEGNNTKIGSADAASDGLSLPLTISLGSVGLGSYIN